MSLEYYLFYRRHYESIIHNLDDIINSTLDPSSGELLDQNHTNFLLENRKHMLEFKTLCDNKILELCNHNFEDDMIDITPDTSKHITYCTVCGYTK
jgi:hypothetical protein